MIWKLIIKVLLKDKNFYTRVIKIKNKVYVLEIEKYKSSDNFIKDIKNVL
ncbi:MAG: hypothetical protein KIB00_17505 [Paeniclostridium sordellii]|nr:hypothetical protein [Paeniclostridium sordellii]